MLEVKKSLAIAITLVLALGVLPRQTALASSSCSVSVAPASLNPGAQSNLQFTIHNTGSDPVAWIQIQRPTMSYTVNGITQSGWTDSTDENGTTLTDGSINPGDSYNVTLAILAAPQEEEANPWTVRLSPSSDGSGMVACDGTVDTSITAPPLPPSPNGEVGVGLSAIAATSVTIAWVSEVASTSYVYYGQTDAYGSVVSVPGSTTTHHVALTGLTPNTVYHYMVAGSDASANNLFSADNTFITPSVPPVQPPANTSTTPASTTPASIYPRVTGDSTPPNVVITTPLSKPYSVAPTITGTVTDNGIVAGLQYSIDNGTNWLPVVSVTGLGTARTTFSFTPIIQSDGNYPIVVKATDSNANQGKNIPAVLIIDRLPPQIGPMVVSFGPATIQPNSQGVFELLAGTSYRLTASSVGGATSAVIEAQPQDQSNAVVGSFNLTQSPDDGLWNGLLSFKLGGNYLLVAKSVDGAGNQTSRPIMEVAVMPAGNVIDAGSHQLLRGAKLTLYAFEPSTQTWQIWDGAPYRQTNPQVTTGAGSFSLLVPAGKYYLSAQAPHHHSFTSNSFETSGSLAIAPSIRLEPSVQLVIGPFAIDLPSWNWQTQPLPKSNRQPSTNVQPIIGQLVPNFSLPTIAGGTERSTDLEGRPTDLVFLTSWSTDSQMQIPELVDAQTHGDVHIMPVFSQERASLISVYLATAGYSLTGIIDPDGVLAPKLHAQSLPEHIFIDRTGSIRKVMVGVLSKNEILTMLGGF